MKDKKSIVWICIIVVLLICGGVCYYIFNNNKDNNTNNVETNGDKYISILINDKKVLRSDLNLTDNAKVNSSKIIEKLNIVLLDIIEPDFQFETHYFFCFDKDGKLISEVRDVKDGDNGNNRYKFNGDFSYDETKNILTLYTNIFLGESDESSGASFNDKDISDLTKDEKKKLGNYSDLVKYEYKYENNKMNLVKKEEISKLKDNAYYKSVLNIK